MGIGAVAHAPLRVLDQQSRRRDCAVRPIARASPRLTSLSVLGCSRENLGRTVFGEVIVYYPPTAPDTPINFAASWVARHQIRGPAILIPEMGLKGRFLYCLLRPELVRSFPKPLSPDAFTAFAYVVYLPSCAHNTHKYALYTRHMPQHTTHVSQ